MIRHVWHTRLPKPARPHPAHLSTLRPGQPVARRVHGQGHRARGALRADLRRLDGLPRAARRADRERRRSRSPCSRSRCSSGSAARRSSRTTSSRRSGRPASRSPRASSSRCRRCSSSATAGQGFFNYFQITMLAFAGGILGVLMMVPLRRALIVKEHGVLPYPEGTACADVLIAGERAATLAKTVFQRPRRRRALESASRGSSRSSRTAIGRSLGVHQHLPQRDAEHRHLARVHGRRLRHRAAHRRRHVRRRRALVARARCPLLSHHGQLPDSAVSAASPASGLRIDQMSPNQLWSAYIRYTGRRRGARRRSHHAGADDPDHRVVVPREHEGLLGQGQPRRAVRAPSGTSR